jgi:hypothetical protein
MTNNMPNINNNKNNQNNNNQYDMGQYIYNPYNNMNQNTSFPNLDYFSDEQGENIKVCVRVRPMNMTELGRNDGKSIEIINNKSINLKNKNTNKSYSYDFAFGESTTQEELFYSCSLNVKI